MRRCAGSVSSAPFCKHVIVAKSPKVARGPMPSPKVDEHAMAEPPRYHCDFCGYSPDTIDYPIDIDRVVPCTKDRPSTLDLTAQMLSFVWGKIDPPTLPPAPNPSTWFSALRRDRSPAGGVPAVVDETTATSSPAQSELELGSKSSGRPAHTIASVSELLRYSFRIRRVNAVLRRHVFDNHDHHLQWMGPTDAIHAATRGREAIRFAAAAYGVPYRGGYFSSMGAFSSLMVAKRAVIVPSVEDQRLAIAGMLRISADDVIVVHNPTSAKDCACTVVVSHAEKLVVLAFRGTITAADMLTDILCDPAVMKLPPIQQPSTSSSFHSSEDEVSVLAADGFVACANHAKAAVLEPLMETARKYPAYRVLVTGHSLGGAVAQLSYILFVRPALGPDVECCVFAPPPCGSDALCEYVDSFSSQAGGTEQDRCRMLAFVYGLDVIPRLQARSLQRLFDLAALQQNEELSTARLKSMHEASLLAGQHVTESSSTEKRGASLCEYYIPGEIVQLQPKSQHQRVRLAHISRSHVSLAYPIVNATAMSDHFLRPTAQALNRYGQEV